MCGNKCNRRRVSLRAEQGAIETAAQTQTYLVEKSDNVQSGLDTAKNELPPVYTEVWEEKSQSSRDVTCKDGSRAAYSDDVKGHQASVPGYDSRITTAAMSTY